MHAYLFTLTTMVETKAMPTSAYTFYTLCWSKLCKKKVRGVLAQEK